MLSHSDVAITTNCLLVTNIAPSATKMQVVHALMTVLHCLEFSPVKINFEFQFAFRKNNTQHSGKGILFLPGKEYIKRLCEWDSEILLLGHRLEFRIDARTPENYELIMERIKNEPWVDLTNEEQLMDTLIASHTTVVEVDYCHFGRYCTDGVFSLEYEWKQKLRVSSENVDLILSPRDQSLTRVMIKPWTVRETLVDTRQNIVMILLSLPCTYQASSSNASCFVSRKDMRPKVACLGPDHAEIAPFVSTGLTLWFKNPDDLAKFLTFIDRIHIKAKREDLFLEIRNLYSGKRLETVKSWFQSLPLALSFQCELLLRSLLIDPSELLTVRPKLDSIFARHRVEESLSFLLNFRRELENGRLYDFQGSTNNLIACFDQAMADRDAFRPLNYSEQLIQCFQIVVTPTTFYLDGPFPDQANRVLRLFPQHRNHFVRVCFADEEHLSLRFNREEDKESYIHSRIISLLKNGIQLYHGHYQFLGYSNSGLREHSVYFVHPFVWKNNKIVDAEGIRGILGDFSKEIYFPARYGARLAQAFTTTKSTVRLSPHQLLETPDVIHNGSTFTDGVGVISKELSDKVFAKLNISGRVKEFAYPFAYQIRLGGLKGVVSVNTELPGSQLLWRSSMKKFDADQFLDLEVARAFFVPGKVTLNRPLIKLLEDLGVPVSVFVDLQNKAIQSTLNSLDSIKDLGFLLENYGLGMSFDLKHLFFKITNLLKLNASDLIGEDYDTLPMIFQTAVDHSLRDMKYSSKIPVPNAYCLVGVADEFNFLKPWEVYACIHDPIKNELTYIEGPVCIYRSPTLHPGDIQMVRAIGRIPDHIKTGLKDVKNALVFSVHPDSTRSLPSMLGGGDLDGDEYCIIVDKRLHPRKRAKAASYEPAVKARTNQPCTIGDVADFVGNYILSDMLGMIATRHLIYADMSPHGTCDPACIKLAELASHAVDFPKSGTPIKFMDIPKLPEDKRPDYLAPEVVGRSASGKFYPSEKAIGILYRSIDLSEKKSISIKMLSKHIKELKLSEKPIHDPISLKLMSLTSGTRYPLYPTLEPDERKEAQEMIIRYNREFIYIAKTNSMVRGKVLTEAEVMVCSILDPTRQPRKRKSLMNTMRIQTLELYRRFEQELCAYPAQLTLQKAWNIWLLSRQGRAYGTESIGLLALNILLQTFPHVHTS
jgi:hypothetical protein